MTKREQARGYRRQGCTYVQIGRLMGISDTWARALCNDEVFKHHAQKSRTWTRSGVCPDCGGPMTQPTHQLSSRGKPGERCRACYTTMRSEAAFARLVQGETLRCRSCKERKPFADYPQGLLSKYLGRRAGKPPQCRACDTTMRTAYRNRHKTPCVKCGTPRVGDEAGRTVDSSLCLSCYRESVKTDVRAA